MTRIELTEEEAGTLEEVLRHSLAMLEVEIWHTDHRDFTRLLKHRREVLERLLARLPAQMAVAA